MYQVAGWLGCARASMGHHLATSPPRHLATPPPSLLAFPHAPGRAAAHRALFRGVLAHGEWGGGDPAPAHRGASAPGPPRPGLFRHLSAASWGRPARGPPLAQRPLLSVPRRPVGLPPPPGRRGRPVALPARRGPRGDGVFARDRRGQGRPPARHPDRRLGPYRLRPVRRALRR